MNWLDQLRMTACREIAAQCWCDPKNAHKEMDVDLAESIAARLLQERRRVDDLKKGVDGGLHAKVSWANKVPTNPGWYWWRASRGASPHVVWFEANQVMFICRLGDRASPSYAELISGEWLRSPIKPPSNDNGG